MTTKIDWQASCMDAKKQVQIADEKIKKLLADNKDLREHMTMPQFNQLDASAIIEKLVDEKDHLFKTISILSNEIVNLKEMLHDDKKENETTPFTLQP